MLNKGCGFIRKFRTCHLKKQKEHDRAWSELLASSTNSREKGNRKKNKTCHLFQLLPLFGSPKNFDEPNNFLLGLKKLNLKRRIFTMIVRELFSFSNNSSQIRLPKCSVPVFFNQNSSAHAKAIKIAIGQTRSAAEERASTVSDVWAIHPAAYVL